MINHQRIKNQETISNKITAPDSTNAEIDMPQKNNLQHNQQDQN
jgi:hypothetical protein